MIVAAVVGISPSMVPSVALLVQLMEHFIWQKELAKTFTVTATLKVTAITFRREKSEWDSGLETAMAANTGWTTMSRIFIEEVSRAQQ